MRQSAERIGMGPLHGAVLPDRDFVPVVRCRSDFSVSVGGRVETPGDVRFRRGADLHLDTCGWTGLRVAARRAGLGLASPMLIEKLKERFGAEILGAETAHGEETITIGRAHAYDILRALRDEPGFEFNFLSDVTAVDWLGRKPRFDVV